MKLYLTFSRLPELQTLSPAQKCRAKICGISFLKKQKPIIAVLPVILCVLVGSIGGYFGVRYCTILRANDMVIQMANSLIMVGSFSILGGIIGRILLNHFIRPYLHAAVAIVQEQTKQSSGIST